mmetsp:Transcript_12489/g.35760  ORF Transcript_12489/g.35760 Transcript_12489/m.35760 type:complete len:292 (-) Transcript_12489:325-1200(-)
MQHTADESVELAPTKPLTSTSAGSGAAAAAPAFASVGTPATSEAASSLTGSRASWITRLIAGEEQLPPPLDFVPKVIDLTKLTSFRLEYQRFRAGHASGAKGEIASSTNASSAVALGAVSGEALPPPLEIIPPSVPRDQLAAWRAEYQRFRAGEARGARGEVVAVAAVASDGPTGDGHRTRRLSRGNSTGSDAGGSPLGSLRPPMAMSVKNTFVHIDVHEGEEASDEEPPPPLPPSLDCIPSSVPPDVLEAYRQDYQRFRAGHASGAKGEVSALAALDLFGLDGSDGGRDT